MAAHLYWRLSVTAIDGGTTFIAMPELEFRETLGGANSAVGGTPIASSVFTSSYSSTNAFDGNNETFWYSDSGDLNGWIGYQFASPVEIKEVVIGSFGPSNGTSTTLSRLPRDFSVEFSDDGVTWVRAQDIIGEGDWQVDEVRSWAVEITEGVHFLTVTNGDFETGDFTGWVADPEWELTSSSSTVSPGPFKGTYFADAAGSSSSTETFLYQDLSVPSEAFEGVDDGFGQVDARLQAFSYNETDPVYTSFVFLDAGGVEIGSSHESRTMSDTNWVPERVLAAVPPGTRTVRLRFRGEYSAGSVINCGVDAVSNVILRSNLAAIPVTNRDASDGLTGWTTSGGFVTDSSQPNNTFKGGSLCFQADGDGATAYQDLAIPSELVGAETAYVHWWQSSYDTDGDNDPGRVGFRFLDGSGGELSSAFSPFQAPTSERWSERDLTAEIPEGTETIRLVMEGQFQTGTVTNAYFDLLSDVFVLPPAGIQVATELQWQLLAGEEVESDPLDIRWEISEFREVALGVRWRVGMEPDKDAQPLGVRGATYLEGVESPVWKGEWKDDPGITGTTVVPADDANNWTTPSDLGNVQLDPTNGALALNFAGDYYYRIWVVPDQITVNNPQIGVPIPFLLWNAYPWDNNLDAINAIGDDGLEITLTAPSLFGEIELRNVDLTILPTAPIQIDAEYTFDFAFGEGVFFFSATIADFVQMVPDVPVTETWEWLTDVITAYDSTEQRVSLRATPRRSSRYKFLLESDAERRLQFGRWYKSLATRLVLPYYQYATSLTQDTPSGTSRLYFDPDLTDVREGEFVIVLDALTETGYLVKLGPLRVDGAELTDPLTFDAKASWVISPAFTSRLADGTGPSMYSVHGEIQVDSESLEVREQFARPGSNAVIQQFEGLPVLDIRPLANDIVNDNLTINYEVIDSQTGLMDIKTAWAHPFLSGSRKFLIRRFSNPVEMDWWRDFLDGCRGQQNPFLLPTWRDDLVVDSFPDNGSQQLKIVSNEYEALYFPYESYKRLQIETRSGIIWRKVVGVAVNNDGTQTLELGQNFGTDPEDVHILKVSFLNLARLGSDRVTLSHGHHDTTIDIKVRVVDA